jgi:tetratricopeptide repeat protein
VGPWLLAQGDSQLTAQDQDLGVLPPHLPPGQAQQRHGAGDDEEDQLQAYKPKIIPRTARCRPTHRPHDAGPERRCFPANLPRWQGLSGFTACEQILGNEDLQTLTTCHDLGLAYLAAGQLTEAITALERSLAGREKILGNDHHETRQSRTDLGEAYWADGREEPFV